MKKLLFIACLAVLALILLAFWLQQDEAPTAESLTWQQWHEAHRGQVGEGYVWLLGFTAPAGESPQQAGTRWLEMARLDYEQSDHRLEALLLSPPAPWEDQRLAGPDSRRLQELQSCRNQTEPPCDEIDGLLGEHAELLMRFRDWPVTAQSQVVAAPDVRLMPAMQPLIDAARLDRVDQLRHLLQSEPDMARELLESSDRKLRSYLAGAPNLLHLMIATRLLADQVDWLMMLERDGLMDLSADDPLLAELDGVGQAFESAFRGEFGLIHASNELLEVDLLGPDAGWRERAELRWFHRPQTWSNQSASLYHWVAALDEPGDLAALGRGEEPIWRDPSGSSHLFGHGIFGMLPTAEPLLDYIGRVHDLSARLALARAVLAEPQLDTGALERLAQANPYGQGYGIEVDEASQRLCFEGPFEDRAQFRCIGTDVPEA